MTPNRYHEEKRLATLSRYCVLDTLPEESFNRFSELAAQGLDKPFAFMSFADTSRHWLKAKVGITWTEQARGNAFCDQTLQSDDVFVVPDARADERFRSNQAVIDPPYIRFYAGAPLITSDGYVIGTLSVLSPDPDFDFDRSKRRFLQELARTVMAELELRRTLRPEREISHDLAFWDRLSAAVANATDFDTALAQALAHCAEQTGAALCFLAQVHPEFGIVRYLKFHVDPESCVAEFDSGKWNGLHSAKKVSFGAALLNSEIYDSGSMEDPAPVERFPILQDLVRAGIRRQIAYPFDLADHHFGLVLDFAVSDIRSDTHGFVRELLTRLTPLLLGRLRERALEHANRALRALHACHDLFSDPQSPEQIYEAACDLVVKTGSYEACWIGLAEADASRSIRPIARAGRSVSHISQLRLSWNDEPLGWGPTGTAIRENRIIVFRELANEPRFAPWRDLADAAGFKSCISLPIRGAVGHVTGALTLYSSDPTAFAVEEQQLLSDLVTNLTKALQALATQRARDAAEEQIYRLAHMDPLTELPNRRLLNDRLEQALAKARRSGKCGALLFIDLNRFKPINDILGHSAGDAVLREAARRFSAAVRATDTVARLGGDEFVVLLPQVSADRATATSRVGTIARKLIDALSLEPFVINAREYHLSASIGFAVFPRPEDTVESLLRDADTAMYRAKGSDEQIVMFEPAMHLAMIAAHALEDKIRAALKTDQFEIWLQDQVDGTGGAIGAEALIRLRDASGRILQPVEFIPVAEASGLIVPMGQKILNEACTVLAQVHRERPDWSISVNVSPRQFRQADFVDDVIAALTRADAPADRLTLEITESLLIEDIASVGETMAQLVKCGVRFSVDDFGTGYSSLQYLRNLPIHEIKIDRSFINQIPGDQSAVAIVEAILAMAQRLGLDVVAEGVETLQQKAFLTARGCLRLQGYLFSKPTPTSAWRTRLAAAPLRLGPSGPHVEAGRAEIVEKNA